MIEYTMDGWPSKKNYGTYISIVTARKDAYKYVSQGVPECTIRYLRYNQEAGAVFKHKDKIVYRRESHYSSWGRKQEYGLWVLNKDGTLGQILG